MRIYQINCSSYGSTGKLALAIHRKLKEEGHVSRFAYGYGKCKEEGTMRISNWFDLRLHSRLSMYTGLIGWFSVICTLRLLFDMKRFQPDIVHMHNLHGNYVNLMLLLRYLRKSNLKVLYTLHDCWAFTGKCPHYTLVGCDKWKTLCHDCPSLKDFPSIRSFDTSRLLYKQKKGLLNSIENLRIATVSTWLAKEAANSYLSSKKIDVVANGIDVSVFHQKDVSSLRNDLHMWDKKILLGVASSWRRQKGLAQWIQLRELLDDSYSIILIGLTKAQKAAMPAGIHIVEQTENQEQLADYYNLADLLINLSKEESFGLVTIEALACGTPVIAYNSTANPELVNENRGFLLNSTNVEDILDGIDHILNLGKEHFSSTCQSFARSGYSLDDMYYNYKAIYQDMCCNNMGSAEYI